MGLANGVLSGSDAPLPGSLGGTSVLFAGRTAPLLSVSDGRIDAIVPYDVPPNTTHQLVVFKGTAATLPEPVTVASAQPAIFTKDKSGAGQGLVYTMAADGAQVLADPSNAVAAGDTILIQCAGLGSVDPSSAAGAAAPELPLSQTTNSVAVRIGGVDAPVKFAGLAPGVIGVYEVQATVPDGVAAGESIPILLTVAGQVSPPVTIAVR